MPKKSNLSLRASDKRKKRRSLTFPFHLATLVMLTSFGLFIALSMSWLLGNPTITHLAKIAHQ